MPLVRALVVTHLSLTAVLLLVFAVVVLCQRLIASARPSAGATPLAQPYPTEPPRSEQTPVRVPAQELPTAGASVLDWTIDLRTPAGSGGRPTAASAGLPASS